MINPAQPPEGILDPQQPWWPTANMRDRSWDILKAKLTGRRMPDGTQYETWVHLTSSDADRLIANIKKYGKYPQVNQTGGQGGYENLLAYQNWLVEEFLEKPFRDETNAKIEEAEQNARIEELRKQAEKNKQTVIIKNQEVPLADVYKQAEEGIQSEDKEEDKPDDDSEQKDLDKGQEELQKELDKLTTEIDSGEPTPAPDDSKQQQDDGSENLSGDFAKIKKSLEEIKNSLSIQSSDVGSTNKNITDSISSLDAIKNVLKTQKDTLQEQSDSAEKKQAESSLEGEAGNILSADVKSTSTLSTGKAEGVVKSVDGDTLKVETTSGEFTKGAKISQGGGGGGIFDAIGKLFGGGGGAEGEGASAAVGALTKLSGGGFLNTSYPAYAEGTIAPGVYNKPTRGQLAPGQAVVPLNRNVGKKMMGDASPDQKRLRKYDQPLIDVMSQPLKAAGMAVLVTAGNFIKALGPLGGFFMPYVKGILTNMSRVLDIPANILMGLVAGPAYAAVEQQDKQQNAFASLWNDLMKSLGLDFLKIGDEEGDNKKKKENGDNNNGPENFEGSANQEKAFNFLKSKGLTAEQAAGVVGNLIQESGVDPNSTNKKSGNTGIAQWDPVHRWGGFVNGMSHNGQTWKGVGSDGARNLENQLRYLWWEIDTGAGGMSLGTLKNAKTIDAAAQSFLEKFERAGEWEAALPQRISNAKGVYNKYNKSAEVGMDTGQGKALNAFTLTGPRTGYPVPGVGTMHGKEALIQYEKGFTVLPIENNKFSLSSDPLATLQRWQQLMGGSPTTKRMFDAGGKFLFPQGKIDFGKTKSKQDVEAAIDSATYNTNDVVLGGKTYTVAVNPYTGEVHQVTKMVDAGWLNMKKNFGMEGRTSVDPKKNKEEFDKVANQSQVLTEVNARRAQLASQYASQMKDAEMNGELSDSGKERLKRMKEFNEILKNKQIQFGKALSKVTINPSKAASVYEERRNERAELTAAGEWGNGDSQQQEANPIENIQNAFSGMISGLALMGAGMQGKVNTKEDWDNLKKEYDSTFKITTATAAAKEDKSKTQATAAIPPASSKQAKPASAAAGASSSSSDISSPPGSGTPKTTAEQIGDMSVLFYC